MHVRRSIDTPIRKGLSIEQRWHGHDEGVIAAWERGRQMGEQDPEFAARARAGELVVLPWKGGLEKALKNGQKFGSNRYLAMWQGLRGDDLEIDPMHDTAIACTATGTTVIFTSDPAKFAGSDS